MMFYNLNQVCVSLHLADGAGVYTGGKGAVLVSCDLMRRLQHLHQEGVDGRVADELEEEEMLQALEADGAQSGQAQQQLGEPDTGKVSIQTFNRVQTSWSSSLTFFPTCPAGRGICVSCTTPATRKPFPSAPPPLGGLKDLSHLSTQSGQMLLCCMVTQVTGVFAGDPPGLKRTMARRQPSSVLSICMSFILDTSSVRTLQT